MKIIEIVLFTREHSTIFICIYTFIVMLQIFLLFKRRNLQRIIIFILHKIIALYTIGFLLLYYKNLKGFYIYIIGIVLIGFLLKIKETLTKKYVFTDIDFFLIGDINLTLFFVLLSFIVINGIE